MYYKNIYFFLSSGSTVNSRYNEVSVQADQTFVIRKFVNTITNYSLYCSNTAESPIKFCIFYNDFHFINFIKNLVNTEIIRNFCSLKKYIYIYTEFQHIKLFYIIVYFFFFIFFLPLNFKIVLFLLKLFSNTYQTYTFQFS